MRYRVGTRGSKLAMAQTKQVIEQLKKAFPEDEFELITIKTTGDMDQKSRLDQIGTKGIFVKEIEEELLDGTIHLAVHSMKDMPDETAEGLIFARAWKREDPRDVLILKNVKSLEELPRGAVIGTGSKRRKYQLLKLRPDLNIVEIRGNVDTRIRKMHENEMDGIVLAAAGIKRIGREKEITQYLEPEQMIPAPAQGTLALEVKADIIMLDNMDLDTAKKAVSIKYVDYTFLVDYNPNVLLEVKADNEELLMKLNTLSDTKTDLCVKVERYFLKQIGGSCHLPVGAYCNIQGKKLVLQAMFGTEDGDKMAYTKAESEIFGDVKDTSDLNRTCRQIVKEVVEKIRIQLNCE